MGNRPIAMSTRAAHWTLGHREKMGARFEPVASWPVHENYKKAPRSEEDSTRLFTQNSICYISSARRERPHWLNKESVIDEPIFHLDERLQGRLRTPIIVESSTQENKQWLLDVMLDAKADYAVKPTASNPPELAIQVLGNPEHLVKLLISRANVQTLLQNVLQDDSVRLVVTYRNMSSHRLSIQRDYGIVPSVTRTAGRVLCDCRVVTAKSNRAPSLLTASCCILGRTWE